MSNVINFPVCQNIKGRHWYGDRAVPAASIVTLAVAACRSRNPLLGYLTHYVTVDDA